MTWTRRRFLGLLGSGVVVGACGGGSDDAAPTTTTSGPSTTTTAPTPETLPPLDVGEPVGSYPFGLGVASGDPDHSSVVLWTWVDRPDGAGVTVEVALDQAFEAVIQRAPVIADPAAAMTVRVLATDLEPDRAYWYRFIADGHVTPPARTRTAPAPGTMPSDPLRVGHLSCQRWSSGYWTALSDVADQAPNVVVHCGDYVYESDRGPVRPVDDDPPTDLEGYRALWRRYKAGPELQAAHAVAPWLIVWDDHEVENNYQGADPGDPTEATPAEGEAFLAQRAAAYRAWWEFTPTRVDPPDGPNLRMYRTVDWGDLTRFVLLDTRQYRDDQPCPPEDELAKDVGPRCPATDTVTMLGAEQEAWFDDVATGHDAVWTTVVEQIVVHQWRFLPGNVAWNLDQWDGYTGARRQLLDVLGRSPAPVVLSGDVHSSWVAELHVDADDDATPLLGTEFVGPGVSSGVPDELRQIGSLLEDRNDHILWSDLDHRGWVLHEITPDSWTAHYRLVDDVTVPDSPVTEAGAWTVDPTDRTVHPTS